MGLVGATCHCHLLFWCVQALALGLVQSRSRWVFPNEEGLGGTSQELRASKEVGLGIWISLPPAPLTFFGISISTEDRGKGWGKNSSRRDGC